MPKISVIIPSYNRKNYIKESIESIRAQSYQDFEIIVVDDGSTDGTLDILKDYGSEIHLIQQKHGERAMARNKGIEESKGDYIAFLDSDDIWLPEKLSLQLEVMESSAQVVCVYGSCLRMDEKSRPLPTAQRQKKGYSGDVFLKLLKRNFVPSPTPLIRRSCFEKSCRFNTKYALYEDWACWLQIAKMGDFHFIPQALASYRVHPKQSVKLASPEVIENSTLSVLEDTFTQFPVKERHKKEALALAYLRSAYWYLVDKQTLKAREALKKALKHDPFFLRKPHWLILGIFARFPFLDRLIDLGKIHDRI